MNPFGWILIALPFYLFVKGRLVDYLKLAGATPNQGAQK